MPTASSTTSSRPRASRPNEKSRTEAEDDGRDARWRWRSAWWPAAFAAMTPATPNSPKRPMHRVSDSGRATPRAGDDSVVHSTLLQAKIIAPK